MLTSFKVADLPLARFGRKENRPAEYEMPGLMALRRAYAAAQPQAGARVTASLHANEAMDVQLRPGR